ncbi:MAG TPA: metallophosphoesterase [Oscillospiraceae bacterium]|nr:hypothetical protein [Oscillospiraceae bacterium]HOV40608.1 metallophosphoesterase [Oscillospiraceae bacterium]
MGLYVIGDLHLSLSSSKPMDVFNGWENYVDRIKANWLENIKSNDVAVLAGDLSWGMSLEESLEDFKFVNALPGKKILLKGNHDYWWNTKKKMEDFFEANGLDTLNILHNNHYQYGEYGICGTRGWINETDEPSDAKILAREAARLEVSIQSAEKAGLKPIVFLHYPPIYAGNYNYNILEVLFKHNIKQCFYGHIHGKSSAYAINDERDGIKFTLISGDFLQFKPFKIF